MSLPAIALLVLALPAAPLSPGPTVAVEDTLRTELPEILVRAPRVTLAEILARVARGEARRDSAMIDQTYLVTMRLVRDTAGRAAPTLLHERVTRIYKKKPNFVRAQLLRNFDFRPKKRTQMKVEMDFDPGMDEEVVNFAFRPEARRDFRYRIVGRDLAGRHLIYRIAFEPRSRLDPTQPHGTVWVDTNDFVIVRQEVGFDRAPAPPLLKGVDRMVIERQNVDGHWVLKRVLVRLEAGLPLPQVGRSFDLGLQFGSYAINTGLPDSLFATARDRR